jgi:hypothetical protein
LLLPVAHSLCFAEGPNNAAGACSISDLVNGLQLCKDGFMKGLQIGQRSKLEKNSQDYFKVTEAQS